MFQKILVPLDGSMRAEYAIPVAIHLARRSGGRIVLVRIVLPSSESRAYGANGTVVASPGTYEKRLVEAEHYLHHVVRLREHDLDGISVEMEVQTGTPASTIFSVARLDQVDLIVLCSHGTHDLLHWAFKSVARDAVHHTPAPILILKETEGACLESHLTQPMRMLVTLDGSQFSEAALQPAIQLVTALSAPRQGEIHLLRVLDLPSIEGKTLIRAQAIKHLQEAALLEAENYLQKVAQRLVEQIPEEIVPVITWSTTVSSHVARAITHTAEAYEDREPEDDYDMLAMATHGYNGLQHLMGGVTEHVLGTTNLPLLVIRPQEQPDQDTPSIKTETGVKA